MPVSADALPVAVIIAAHNRAEWIGQAVASALDQRPHPPSEVIVVDDRSTDDTAAVAYAAGARVVRHEVNRGAAAARNTGAAATEQPWIAPLDSDDWWTPHMLGTLWPLRGEYGLVAGASMSVDEEGRPGAYGGPLSPEPIVLGSPAPLIFPENFIPASGVILRRDVFEHVGGYRTDQRQAEDLDLWIRVLQVEPVLCVPEVVTMYRIHATQKSRGGADSRTSVLRLIERYRDESWYQAKFVECHRAVMAWDDLRDALSAGERRRAVSRAWWLCRTPIRRRALRATLARRRAGRRRAAEWMRRSETLGRPLTPRMGP